MMTDDARYIAYLLRLWAAEEEGEVCWRASLESPQGGPRTSFRSLRQLFLYLEDQVGEEGEGDWRLEIGD